MTGMEHLVAIKGRFARSVRLDADSAADALEGYLPTGRSLDVLRRVARGMIRDDAARAFSITGPYGSGKSSLAVMLDACLGPVGDEGHQTARRILTEHAPEVLAALDKGRNKFGGGDPGFVRAVITTPQREPVMTTVVRALLRGSRRAGHDDLAASWHDLLTRAESTRFASPAFVELKDLLEVTCQRQPVLLVIDEFGKNLEAYADAGADGDLYLLQELAELTQGADRLPLLLATIQHLAFEAYATDATAAQRREWAKVQGRLEDIAFLDSPAATRRLIAAAIVHDANPTATWLRHEAAYWAAHDAAARGAAEVADPQLLAACWPLHPSVLLVLPDLCARYGQNERTLFGFLASDAPQSAKSMLAQTPGDAPLPWVRLDWVYDYFVDSASTFVGASRDASRWIEIETTMRDAHGLSAAQARLLKTIGVFNLVSAVGTVRASTELLCLALAGAGDGLTDDADVVARLTELVDLGVVVYRDFAGEYRIWQGSDFDLDGALTSARRRAAERSPAELLAEVMPLSPLVAARHAVQHGTTRAFERVWADARTSDLRLPAPDSACDGLLVYVADPKGQVGALPDNPHGIPIITVTAEPAEVIRTAAEVAALTDVAADPRLRSDDHAVRRELGERLGHARQLLQRAISDTYGPSAIWTWVNPRDGWAGKPRRALGSSLLSDVFDLAYPHPWKGDYEPINRAELSSAGAKARRTVLNALVDPDTRVLANLGLTGHGADVAIYRTIYADTGLHAAGGITGKPHKPWRPVWDTLMRELDDATQAPVSAAHLLDRLMLPPHGLRAGIASMVFVAGLLHRAADIAIYEHGTFKPRLTGALIDRLVRNPGNFAVKHLAAANPRSIRGQVVAGLAEALDVEAGVLPVTLTLVRLLGRGSKYLRTTQKLHLAWSETNPQDQRRVVNAVAVRDAIIEANEPDELLFSALPNALGFPPATPPGRSGMEAMTRQDVTPYIRTVAQAADLLRQAPNALINHIAEEVLHAATRSQSVADLIAQAERVAELDVAAKDVRTFAGQAMLAGLADTTDAWVTSLATACTGSPPADWTDADIGPNIAKLVRIATDFRRVAYLANVHSNERGGDSFTAWMLSATRTDGTHNDVLVALPTRHAQAADAAAATAIEHLEKATGLEPDAAVEALMASLVSRLVADEAGEDESDEQPAVQLANEQPERRRPSA